MPPRKTPPRLPDLDVPPGPPTHTITSGSSDGVPSIRPPLSGAIHDGPIRPDVAAHHAERERVHRDFDLTVANPPPLHVTEIPAGEPAPVARVEQVPTDLNAELARLRTSEPHLFRAWENLSEKVVEQSARIADLEAHRDASWSRPRTIAEVVDSYRAVASGTVKIAEWSIAGEVGHLTSITGEQIGRFGPCPNGGGKVKGLVLGQRASDDLPVVAFVEWANGVVRAAVWQV